MPYLVRMSTPGASGLMRDGKGFSSEMRKVSSLRFTPFCHLPSGCDPSGGHGIEIVACCSEREMDSRLDVEEERVSSEVENELYRRAMVADKMRAQVAAGVPKGKALPEKTDEVDASAPATLSGTVEDSDGFAPAGLAGMAKD